MKCDTKLLSVMEFDKEQDQQKPKTIYISAKPSQRT